MKNKLNLVLLIFMALIILAGAFGVLTVNLNLEPDKETALSTAVSAEKSTIDVKVTDMVNKQLAIEEQQKTYVLYQEQFERFEHNMKPIKNKFDYTKLTEINNFIENFTSCLFKQFITI